MKCWETRGCEGPESNYDHCPHAMLNGVCPVDCAFAVCERPAHEQADVMDMLVSDADREVAVKEICGTCKFFLAHAPRMGVRPQDEQPAWKEHYAQYYQDPSVQNMPAK